MNRMKFGGLLMDKCNDRPADWGQPRFGQGVRRRRRPYCLSHTRGNAAKLRLSTRIGWPRQKKSFPNQLGDRRIASRSIITVDTNFSSKRFVNDCQITQTVWRFDDSRA